MTRIGSRDWDLQTLAQHVWRLRPKVEDLAALAQSVKDDGGQLIALWGSDERGDGAGFVLHAAFMTAAGLVWSSIALSAETPTYPDLAHIFPQADRMQRAVFRPARHQSRRTRSTNANGCATALGPQTAIRCARILGSRWHPIRRTLDAYPNSSSVEGDGVHEIPVGPIHAGTIEPGHFRFSIIGDRVLQAGTAPGLHAQGHAKSASRAWTSNTGARLAGRVSGDSHSAYAWAYCIGGRATAVGSHPAAARRLAARAVPGDRTGRQSPGRPGLSGQRRGPRLRLQPVLALKEDWLRLSAQACSATAICSTASFRAAWPSTWATTATT
jgi:hypothetical protein